MLPTPSPPLARPLRCLVVDDDPAAVQVLCRCLEQTPELTLAGTCADAFAALDFLRHHPVDVLLLDVSLPVLSGLDLLQVLLHTLPSRPYTILVSANAHYAVDAFTYSVTDYLLKPLSAARFEQAVRKLRVLATTPVEAAAPADFLFVRSGGQQVRVDFADVCYLEAAANYVYIVTPTRRLRVYTPLRALAQRFPPRYFFSMHRSFLVNLRRVDWVDNQELCVQNRRLPISPLLRAPLLEHLNVLQPGR